MYGVGAVLAALKAMDGVFEQQRVVELVAREEREGVQRLTRLRYRRDRLGWGKG